MRRENIFRLIGQVGLYSLMLIFVMGVATLPGESPAADVAAEGSTAKMVTGTLDGFDLIERRIWIDDMIYKLDNRVKVKGTANKLGLMSDLKQGEIIKAWLKENEDTPSIPYVTRIERQ